jgi:transcriptional regulator with XRE-family HTH domain
MTTVRDLQKLLEDYEKTAESAGYDLRLDLAEIVLKALKRKGWTQKQLAAAAGKRESFITRIIHSANNCTFEVAGQVLFALGIKARLAEAYDDLPIQPAAYRQAESATSFHYQYLYKDIIHGEEPKNIRSAGTPGPSAVHPAAIVTGSDPGELRNLAQTA